MAGKSLFKRLMSMRILGASIGGAAVIFVGGIVAWGGFNTAMEATNTMEFCISCHEMEDTVYQEYKQTVHYENRTGVRATCPDCHVPDPWVHKIVRKIKASKELWHKALGTISTPEKFEAKRAILANNEWERMKATNSRECRNCHSFTAMKGDAQKRRAAKQHETAIADGQTCIDCHKGIAHRKPNEDGTPLPTWAEHQKQERERLAALAAAKAAAEKAEAEAAAAAAKAKAVQASLTTAAPAAAGPAAAAGAPAIDWDAIEGREVKLLYPGHTSYEWVQNGPQHGGARAYKKGEPCSGCHEGEQFDMGKKMVTGEKAENQPIPGKAPGVPLTVKAAHDGTNLYMRFAWPVGAHVPVPFAEGGKMDAENEAKLALMIDGGKVERADLSGCWQTCHSDARSMPDAPDAEKMKALADRLDVSQGVTKYLPSTRTEIEISGNPQGGWDKLKPQAELDQAFKDGVFLDLLRWKSGNGGVSEDGYVAAQRVMDGGQGVSFVGTKQGDQWVVTMTRKLQSDAPGDVSIAPGQTYTVGFAVHDDFSDARFHHVSIDYRLALDNPDVEINAVKIDAPAAAAAPAQTGAVTATPAAATAAAAPAAGGSVDWSKASEKEVALLYPGQTSYEWVLEGTDHGGARAYAKKGELCSGCHEGEQADMGNRMVTGEKAEETPIPGKPGGLPMTVRATHDAENLYMRFEFPANPHVPVPFAEGGKMDPENEVKLALMIDGGNVPDADRSACWQSCHHDARSMPHAPADPSALKDRLNVADGVTKYLPGTRTEIAVDNSANPRGGWDKLKPAEEIEKMFGEGYFLDLLRWKSGNGGVSEDGYVAAERVMDGGQGVTFSGEKQGDKWVVTMTRKLKSDAPGDVSIEPGKTYTVGFAVHDDHSDARFHHVSLDYTLALDNPDAAINAPAQ